MPNRIIKESICTSEQISALSQSEEIFFYRLLVNCDDYGLLDARPTILRAKCFPLSVDKVKDKDVEKWLLALAKQSLIVLYSSNGQPYLKMTTWEKHQRIRAQKSKYPSPATLDSKLLTIDSQPLADASVIQSNPIQIQSESESEYIHSKKNKYAEYVFMIEEEYRKLIEQFGEEKTKDWIEALNLWKGSKGKSTKSDYLTILNWDRNEQKKNPSKTTPKKDKFKALYQT